MCGVEIYGEAEYSFSILKVMAVIGFIILGVVINVSYSLHSNISVALEVLIQAVHHPGFETFN